MRTETTYNDSDYYVEWHSVAPVPSRNDREDPGEPGYIEIDTVILLDCDEDGNELNMDATNELANDDQFINHINGLK